MPSATSRLPKYVYAQTILKNDRAYVYYRFRRNGLTVKLPGGPGDPEFHRAYASHLTMSAPPEAIHRRRYGSFSHLIDLYIKSPEFSQLADGTQRDYRRYLNRLDGAFGHLLAASLDTEFVLAIRDRMRDTPNAANHMLSVLNTLFNYGILRGILKTNPATIVPDLRVRSQEYERWPDEMVDLWLGQALDDMRVALAIGVYTGQRLSDVIKMRWEDYSEDRVRVIQQKTHTPLVIPAHPELTKVLSDAAKGGTEGTILKSKSGLAYHPRVFSRDFLNERQRLGIPEGLSFHGLRHTAASRLAEVGCTETEIMSITGHKSLSQVSRYTKQARQSLLADSAMAKLVAAKR